MPKSRRDWNYGQTDTQILLAVLYYYKWHLLAIGGAIFYFMYYVR